MFTEEETGIFLEELEEKLQIISDHLLLLERNGSSPEVIQEIFRAAHTIKGSSAVMGYEKMSALTHELENVFDRLRRGTLKINGFLIDALLEALDVLSALKEEIVAHKKEITDTATVTARLKEWEHLCQNSAVPEPHVDSNTNDPALQTDFILNDIEESMVREAEVRGYQAYWVTVGIDPGCQMKAARAFLVFETLQQTGEIIKSIPGAEDLQEGHYDQGFAVLLFANEDAGQIRNLVLSIAEITSVEISQLQLPVAVAGQPGSEEFEPKEHGTQAAPQQAARENIKTVRVDVVKLDKLMNLVGELVIDRTRLDRFADVFKNRYNSSDLAENIVEISNHLGQVTNNLQEEIMKARMLPIAYIFNRLPRMVRDLAHKVGKEALFLIEGRDTELDRNVIEVIGDPLIHLLRNAVDHGIEPPAERIRLGKPRAGRILLKASYAENYILITISDDGQGINPAGLRQKAVEKGILTAEAANHLSDKEVLDLIFTPGFSTASNISDISGRGVGMDIVRSQIEQINGFVECDSAPGRGTTFTIKLPLTLAIIRALMVKLGVQVYAFPLASVKETLAIEPGEIRNIQHNEVIVVRGQVLPLLRLSRFFQEEDWQEGFLFVVVLGSGNKRVGVVVNQLIGEQEIVIKSLGNYLGQVAGLSGATILGDGSVALIVDARSIIKESGVEEAACAAGHATN